MHDWSIFEALRAAWGPAWNVIPTPPGAKGPRVRGMRFGHLNKPHSPRVELGDVEAWKLLFRRNRIPHGPIGGYILPASGIDHALAIVDVDDPEQLGRVLDVFGDSPLKTTRRGQVKHLYFRLPHGWRLDKIRSVHRIGLWGRGSVDVITTTGAMLPGSIHPDGSPYETTAEVCPGLIESLPVLDVAPIEAAAEVWGTPEQAAAADLEPYRGDASTGFVHLLAPVMRATQIHCGFVLPDTPIQGADGRTFAAASAPTSLRYFASYRPDTRPSATIGDYAGRRRFTDWSCSPPRFWIVLHPGEESQDPALPDGPGDYWQRLDAALESIGVEVVHLEDDGWISDQVPEIPDDCTAFIIAAHGTGKTQYAKREADRAKTAISVTNTRALTIANAAALGLRAVYEGIDPDPRASVCIPSLPRIEDRPEFFHVDEADGVHTFIHARSFPGARFETWCQLAHLLARSTRALVTSADLEFPDVALFVRAIRSRHRTRRILVYVRRPTRAKVSARLVAPRLAKAVIHSHVQDALPWEPSPLWVATSRRSDAGAIAMGYAAAKDGAKVISLDAVDLAVLDRPEPEAVEDLRREIMTKVAGARGDGSWFVSGENSRFEDVIRWLEHPDQIVQDHGLVVASPAIQSGVSVAAHVDRVIAVHEARTVPASTLIQMVRRVRNPANSEILIGVPAWQPRKSIRTDRASLDDLVHTRHRRTLAGIAVAFPEVSGDHPSAAETDPEFLLSWRIAVRKNAESLRDPVGELLRTCERHGIPVTDDRDRDLTPREDADAVDFQAVTTTAKRIRAEIDAVQIASAEKLDPDDLEQREQSPALLPGDRQDIAHTRIADFYDQPVTPALVRLDNRGRYRSRVRAYTHALLVASGHAEAVIWRDHKIGAGKRRTEYDHAHGSALIFCHLFESVAGRPFDGSPWTYRVAKVRPLILRWWRAHAPEFKRYHPRTSGPAPDHEAQWLGARLRETGATLTTSGASADRQKHATWSTVDHAAMAYGDRLIRSLEQRDKEKEKREWEDDFLTR